MKKLISTFEKCFEMQFPMDMLPDVRLNPFDEKELLFGSDAALERPFLLQGEMDEFIESCPENYVLTGFWGHGVNSYAFYYSVVESWRRIFFRLPYGGVYENNIKNARNIRNFLQGYSAFEKDIKKGIKQIIAIDSMGEGYYKLTTPDERVVEYQISFFKNPNFEGKF